MDDMKTMLPIENSFAMLIEVHFEDYQNGFTGRWTGNKYVSLQKGMEEEDEILLSIKRFLRKPSAVVSFSILHGIKTTLISRLIVNYKNEMECISFLDENGRPVTNGKTEKMPFSKTGIRKIYENTLSFIKEMEDKKKMSV